ncbi:hypothetical protein M0R45_006237 [Rubus argutus]|uniref:Secreted protein n=1 Tax=Rubus argutus TaxID=59490 RepID=A0AAW1YQH3_RUBAR
MRRARASIQAASIPIRPCFFASVVHSQTTTCPGRTPRRRNRDAAKLLTAAMINPRARAQAGKRKNPTPPASMSPEASLQQPSHCRICKKKMKERDRRRKRATGRMK